jgi:hypothetical protein
MLSSIKGTSTIEIKILSYFMLETWKGSCGPPLILGMYPWATMLQATTLKLGEPCRAGLPFTQVLLRLDISLSINHNFHYLKKKPHSTFVTKAMFYMLGPCCPIAIGGVNRAHPCSHSTALFSDPCSHFGLSQTEWTKPKPKLTLVPSPSWVRPLLESLISGENVKFGFRDPNLV